MISLVPTLHDLVGSVASRNAAQLRELGVEPNERGVRLAVNIERVPTQGRWLLASTLIDMLLRLDPLVREVQVAAPEAELQQLVSDLRTRLPFETRDTETAADYVIGIGPESTHPLLLSMPSVGSAPSGCISMPGTTATQLVHLSGRHWRPPRRSNGHSGPRTLLGQPSWSWYRGQESSRRSRTAWTKPIRPFRISASQHTWSGSVALELDSYEQLLGSANE